MPDGEVFVYKHIGDRPLRLAEDAVDAYLPGAEVRTKAPITSNANFEPVSDNAKAYQAQVDADDAVRLKEHLARVGALPPADEASQAPSGRSRKPAAAPAPTTP